MAIQVPAYIRHRVECNCVECVPDITVVYDHVAAFWTFGREAWFATVGDYDLDCTVGTGKTPLDAIVDLLDQIDA